MSDSKVEIFYYLDGLEKKGPYNTEEIKSRKLSLETLIFKEGSNNWLPLANFPELHQPELEQSNETETKSVFSNTNVEEEKIKIHPVIIICFGLVLCCGISFLIAYVQKMNDLKRFKNEIDNLFNGKSVISDYSLKGTSGQLYKVILGGRDLFGNDNGEKDEIYTTRHFIMYKPFLKENADEYDIRSYNRKLKEWDEFKVLVEYYEADRHTGFSVLRLKKGNDMFRIVESWSGDMAYKVEEYEHRPGYSSSYYSSPGYDIPTYRASVNEAYKEAAKFLTVEDEDKSYEAGSYSRISSFDQMESNFYKIDQSYPRYSYYSDTIFVQNGPGEYGRQRSYMIDNEKITRNTSRTDGNVFNNQWIVWYKSCTNSYEIKEKDWIYFKKISIYSSGLFAIYLVVFIIIKYRKRIQF